MVLFMAMDFEKLNNLDQDELLAYMKRLYRKPSNLFDLIHFVLEPNMDPTLQDRVIECLKGLPHFIKAHCCKIIFSSRIDRLVNQALEIIAPIRTKLLKNQLYFSLFFYPEPNIRMKAMERHDCILNGELESAYERIALDPNQEVSALAKKRLEEIINKRKALLAPRSYKPNTLNKNALNKLVQ